MAPRPSTRRSVLIGTATACSSLLAGCLGNAGPDDSAGSGTDPQPTETPTATPTPTPSGPDPGAIVDRFVSAASAEDTEALADVVHPESPIHPSHFEDTEWEFEGGRYEEYAYSNATVIDESPSIDQVREFEGVRFWFQDRDLDEVLADSRLRIVGVDLESESSTDRPTKWVLATADDEWRVFWLGQTEETPENPEEAFDEEIIDEDHDVVADIEWDVDPERNSDVTPSEDVHYAKVRLTDDPGIEAERVVIESTIAGSRFEFFSREEGEATSSWAGSWANVQIDPAGDQIVVTAIRNDTEEVVHREHYRPDEES